MKQILTVGKSGPFSHEDDPIPEQVQVAFNAAVGLTRNEFARLALLCLDEAADSRQIRTLELVRRLLIDNGVFGPE